MKTHGIAESDMSDDEKEPQADEASPPATDVKEKKPFPLKSALASAIGAIAVGGAAAGAAYLVTPTSTDCLEPAASAAPKERAKPEIKDVAYINIEPLIISLGPEARSKYLKISISLETSKSHEEDLNALGPRIRDVLNSYLRAVDEGDLQRPAGMTRLRAQMLRRLQLVAPDDSISDILITDFVLT